MLNLISQERLIQMPPAGIPEEARELLVARAETEHGFVSEEDGNPDVTNWYALEGRESVHTYFAQHVLALGSFSQQTLEVVDLAESGRCVGAGQVRFPGRNNAGFFEQPFVGWNSTRPDAQNKGLGTRRLLAMHAATSALFNLPLSSGGIEAQHRFSEEPRFRMWRTLEREGLVAVHAVSQQFLRYRFLDANSTSVAYQTAA